MTAPISDCPSVSFFDKNPSKIRIYAVFTFVNTMYGRFCLIKFWRRISRGRIVGLYAGVSTARQGHGWQMYASSAIAITAGGRPLRLCPFDRLAPLVPAYASGLSLFSSRQGTRKSDRASGLGGVNERAYVRLLDGTLSYAERIPI